MPSRFAAPIPGQSLTDTPKNAPWERPPEMVDPVQIVEFYIDKMQDEELLQDLSVVFELGGDLKTLTESLMLIGTMNGLHTTEAGILVAPVIGTVIKLAMEEMGVEVRETNTDYEKASTDRENKRMALLIKDAIEKDAADDGNSSGILQEMAAAAEGEMPAEEETTMTEEQPEPKQMGLMAKGTV
jgi:hypothetical protein